MRGMDVVGVGKIIMRQHQHLAGIHVVGDALVLEVMRFANEVVDADRYSFPPASAVRAQERTIAVQLIKSLLSSFAPDKYTDDYRANLQRIIKAKSKGKHIKLDAAPAQDLDAGVLDLMARLKQSLSSKGGAKGAVKGASKSAAKAKPTRPLAAKKARRRSA
jgi:DNA end-binding protein Ku